MWRILSVTSGSNAQAVSAMQFFGVDPADIFAPYIVRRIPNLRAHKICARSGKRRRYSTPMRDHVAPMFPGYVFVRADDPVACGVVEFAVRGKAALLRPEPSAEPSAVAGDWIDALHALCVTDANGRKRIADTVVQDQWRDHAVVAQLDPLRAVVEAGAWSRVTMVAGPFEGLCAEIEPVVEPEALVAAMKDLDESGRLRVSFLLFGSRRSVVVPREQVEIDGVRMPIDA